MEKKSIFKKWWFWVVAVIILIGVIGAATGGDEEAKEAGSVNTETTTGSTLTDTAKESATPEKHKEEAIKITATELYQAYNDNEVGADEKYKGKLIEVTGVISDIGKDLLDTPYVSIKTDDIIGTVQCMFSKDDASLLANLKKDEQITIRGKCKGYLMNVLLENCEIVK